MADEIKEDVKKKAMVDEIDETDEDSKKCANCYSFIGKLKFRNRLFDPSHPLYLPKGSVRALITLLVIGVTLFCYLKKIEVDEQLWMLVTTVVAFYFGSRLNYGDDKTDKEKK